MESTIMTLCRYYKPLKNAVGKKNMLGFAKEISWLPKTEQKDIIAFAKELNESGYKIGKVKRSDSNILDIFSTKGGENLTHSINFDKKEMTQIRENSRKVLLPSWLKPPFEKITERVTSSIETGKAKMYKTVVEASKEQGGKVVQKTTTLDDPLTKRAYKQIVHENGAKEYYKRVDDSWKQLFV